MRSLLAAAAAVALLLGGCSLREAPVSPQQKLFEEEDAYALFALDAEAHGQYTSAAQYYALLYEKAPRTVYRDRFFENLLRARRFDDVLVNVDEMESGEGYDTALERYRIRALTGNHRLDAAKEVGLALVAKTRAKQDYVAVADIYAMQKHYDTALKYLQSAYAIDYDESVLDKLAVVMYVNLDRKKEAIAELETHIRLNGCSEQTCKRLAGFYSDQNNIEGMLNTYLRLYASYPDPQVAEAIVRIYSYQKDLIHLRQFLEQYHSDDALLLRLYVGAKEYAKASELGEKLYETSGDAAYLGQSAIFEFEGAVDKRDPALIKRVVDKLENAVRSDPDPLLLNYLGYLLIDNDVDPEAGMVYVRQALEQEPDSPFFLDSLAWGYYKLGQCRKADSVMQQAVRAMNGETDPELSIHLEAIGKCLRKGKK